MTPHIMLYHLLGFISIHSALLNFIMEDILWTLIFSAIAYWYAKEIEKLKTEQRDIE